MSRRSLFNRIGAWLEDVASGGKLAAEPKEEAQAERARVVEIVDRAQLVRLLTATREHGGIDGRKVLDVQFTSDKITLVFAPDEAERLRAKEAADHAAWLRENAWFVVLPEPFTAHDAGRLANDILNESSSLPQWDSRRAARLASSLMGVYLRGKGDPKPGERALADLLAEEREAGKREAQAEHLASLKQTIEQVATVQRMIDSELPVMLAEERAKGVTEERKRQHEGKAAHEARVWDEGYRKGAAEERDACAAVARAWVAMSQQDVDEAGERIAEAILARGQS